MKRIFTLVLVLSLAFAFAVSAADLKVAILAPLSGPVPTFGVSTRDGALLAINEWNKKGGVLGMNIVPVVEDSQCTPDPAVNAANKVINHFPLLRSVMAAFAQVSARKSILACR